MSLNSTLGRSFRTAWQKVLQGALLFVASVCIELAPFYERSVWVVRFVSKKLRPDFSLFKECYKHFYHRIASGIARHEPIDAFITGMMVTLTLTVVLLSAQTRYYENDIYALTCDRTMLRQRLVAVQKEQQTVDSGANCGK